MELYGLAVRKIAVAKIQAFVKVCFSSLNLLLLYSVALNDTKMMHILLAEECWDCFVWI